MLTFAIAPDSEEDASEAAYWAKRTRTPHCYQCGRFCRILSDTVEYDGWGMQNYVKFDCKRCGVYTESMW